MASLVLWLRAHKDRLISLSLQELSAREPVRQAAEGPVRWFFDSLIETISKNEHERLEALLRNWVRMCAIPINGQPVGLLPVLGVFKAAIWQVFQSEPPSENALALAVQLDMTIGRAAEYLSKLEAAALLDVLTHQIAAPKPQTNELESAKETFVSIAAHELKTPLTVIEGYANMLKNELPETSHPREALMIRGIESGVVRLREFVEDLVDVSLMEVDLLQLELQPVWLRRLLAIVETEAQNAIITRKLTLEIQQDTIPAQPINADPERLLKALQKVLMNAIKYTPDGGRICIYSRSLNGFVDVIIEDSGIGIAPEKLDTIFEKFTSLSNPNLHSSGKVKFKGGGAGLGLVIAKGIIEAHGGSIWAESSGADEEKLPGSRFHLMLPVGKPVVIPEVVPMVLQPTVIPVQPAGSETLTAAAADSQAESQEHVPATAIEGRAPGSVEAQQEIGRDTPGRLSS